MLPAPSPFSRREREEKTRYECQVALCVTILIFRSLAESNVVFEYFDKLLPSTSLAELCMNVYFSDEYDESEFIIVNSMLYCVCPVYPGASIDF